MIINEQSIADNYIKEKPFYVVQHNELELAQAAYDNKLPLLLKGPTGCGKTRFMQYLAWKLKRPLVTVSCHDDLSTSDLVGRYLIKGNETVWVDGPLTTAVKHGAICYLDEIVEARKDTTVIIHPLADDRRELPIEKLGVFYSAQDKFMLSISYNPGYQSVLKDLKPSTRQRFVSISFDYPPPELEAQIVQTEAHIDQQLANQLVKLGIMTRGLKESGLPEGASTRLLIQTGLLVNAGINTIDACRAGIAESLTDDSELLSALNEMILSIF